MTYRGTSEPPVEPVTTRIGGGVSARLVALIAVAVLGGVTWIGVAGRSNDPPPAALAVPSSAPSPRPPPEPTPTPGQSDRVDYRRPADGLGQDGFDLRALLGGRRYLGVLDEIEQVPDPPAEPTPTPQPLPPIAPLTERYVVAGTVGAEQFRTQLVEVKPGYLAGEYWLASPPDGDELFFRFARRVPRSSAGRDVIGRWNLGLDVLSSDQRAGLEQVIASAPPRPRMLAAPVPIQRGYELHVSVRLAFNEVAVVYFEMVLGPTRRILGEDGLIGAPSRAATR